MNRYWSLWSTLALHTAQLTERYWIKLLPNRLISNFRLHLLVKEEIITTMLKVEKFVVGDKMQKNVLMSVVDFPKRVDNLDGLLGMDFMGKYRIMIETDKQTLVLREIPKKK